MSIDFLIAVSRGDVYQVSKLLETNTINVDYIPTGEEIKKYNNHLPAIGIALQQRNYMMAHLLLAKGANINIYSSPPYKFINGSFFNCYCIEGGTALVALMLAYNYAIIDGKYTVLGYFLSLNDKPAGYQSIINLFLVASLLRNDMDAIRMIFAVNKDLRISAKTIAEYLSLIPPKVFSNFEIEGINVALKSYQASYFLGDLEAKAIMQYIENYSKTNATLTQQMLKPAAASGVAPKDAFFTMEASSPVVDSAGTKAKFDALAAKVDLLNMKMDLILQKLNISPEPSTTSMHKN